MTITQEDRAHVLDIVRALRRRGYRDAGYVNQLGDRDEVTGLAVYTLPGNARASRLNLGYTVSYAPCRVERYYCIEYDDAVKGVSTDSALTVYLNRLKGVPEVGDDGVPSQVAGPLRASEAVEAFAHCWHELYHVPARKHPTATR